jgi:branched-chain amino acid transport system permease protein
MLQALISGVLVGSVYGLFSMGFSLAFGVMRIVNFAHGELVMIGMFVGLYSASIFGVDPLFAMPLAIVIVGAASAGLYLFVFRRFVGAATLQQLLAAIAVALILQTAASLAFGPSAHAVRSNWGSQYVLLGAIFLSYAQLAAFVISLVFVALVEGVLRGTAWGKSIRAIADDPEAAQLVGLNAHFINVSAFAGSGALAGIAGCVLVSYYPVSPHVGFALMPIALIATVLGGLGSVGGAFIGGIVCGVVQQVTSVVWTSALQDVPLYLILILLLAFRPYGLFGRKSSH